MRPSVVWLTTLSPSQTNSIELYIGFNEKLIRSDMEGSGRGV
jgi:hypothetical protein